MIFLASFLLTLKLSVAKSETKEKLWWCSNIRFWIIYVLVQISFFWDCGCFSKCFFSIFRLQPAMVADTFTQAWPAIFYRTSPVAVSEPLITVLSLIKKLIIWFPLQISWMISIWEEYWLLTVFIGYFTKLLTRFLNLYCISLKKRW